MRDHAIRSLKNKMTDEYIRLEKENAPYEELHNIRLGTSAKAPVEGDVDWGMVQAGQSLSVINSIKSCKDIIDTIVYEAKKAALNLNEIFEI